MSNNTKLANAPTLTTKLHYYYFDISKDGERAAWRALYDRLKESHGRCLEAIGSNDSKFMRDIIKPVNGQEVTLDCGYLFENQWNGLVNLKGARLFDWQQPIYTNRDIKEGYYLEITDEMRAIRQDVLKCGYCGAHYWAADAPAFCEKCLGSIHLQESDLRLLRLLPVGAKFGTKRDELTAAEKAELLPIFIQEQTQSKESEAGKHRAAEYKRILEKRDGAIESANDEYDGLKWLLDKGMRLDNVIYYNHTRKFSFGWRKPLGDAEKSALLDLIAEFPFDYEIKDGSK